MSSYHLAQLNIAIMKYTREAPEFQGFVDNLERINALADNAPGFVWRLQTESGDATAIDAFGPETLVNMSLWRDVPSLHHYVYKTAHVDIMRQRKQWFSRMEAAYSVLWWVPAGHIPSLEEARARLELLRNEGPSRDAFSFKNAFPAPDDTQQPVIPDNDGAPA